MARTREEVRAKAIAMTHVSPLAEPLKGYRFAVRTNLKKKLLTNRDALCVLFYVHGHLTRKQARDAMMTWRFGKATYCDKPSLNWDRYVTTQGKSRPATEYSARPTTTFNAWFNLSSGYGHCGKDVMSPGVWMTSWQGDVSCRYFRRHYWFRTKFGRYTGTVEGVKRMAELLKAGYNLGFWMLPQNKV